MRFLLPAFVLALSPLPTQAAAISAQARFDAAVTTAHDTMIPAPRSTLAQVKQAEPLLAALPTGEARAVGRATLLWLRAEALYRIDDSQAAQPLIDRALSIVRRAQPGGKLEADILLTHGSISGKQAQVGRALADFQVAHRLFHKVGDQRHEAITLICLATLYLDAKDYPTALRYLQEALDAYPADPRLALAIHNDRGIAFHDAGLYGQADAEYQQALSLARQADSPTIAAKFLRNIARNDLFAGQLARADRAIMAARALPMSADDDRTQLDAVAAQAALQHGSVAQAGVLVDRAFAGVDFAKTDLSFREAHRTAVATYRALGRFDDALVHLEALKRLDDEAAKLATETNNALMSARFDSANQDAKIARLNLEDDLQRARAQRALLLGAAGSIAVVVVLLLIGFFTIRRSRDQVRAANDDLAVTNSALGKALAAKTEFLATTSHEIRTPLNGILGMTQVMLADAKLQGPARERLTVVHGAGLTMKALVDDILDVAKMETGNLALEHAPFDLAACLRDASALWAEQAQAKGLAFTVELEACPRMVEGDAARVRQVAFNLLSNALKFTAAGSVTLRAEAVEAGARIVVTDTGIGIAADKQQAVFESFRQADASTTRQFGGTGLGLSICRNLVEAMGGRLTLDSAEGRGSTFTVTLPLTAAAIQAPSAAAGPQEGMLIVDRNPIARAMFKTLFAPRASTVLFASTAEEAAQRLDAGGIARVLIDDATARASGDPHAFVAAIATAARGLDSSLLWPVAAEREQDEFLALGVTRVIAKPISGNALVARLFATEPQDFISGCLVSQAA